MIRLFPKTTMQRSAAKVYRSAATAAGGSSSSTIIESLSSTVDTISPIRQFSTKSKDKDSKSGKKSKGPVSIGRTARSKRSRGRGPHMDTRGDKRKQDSMISHIISGGTPLDPAPPPFELANFGEDSVYTLVLLRHGESEWNKLNQYTGWCDVNLTKKGELEARAAGRLLYENGIEIDHAFTSVLKRASFSCNMALNMANQHWVPVTKSWRLNERHYGA